MRKETRRSVQWATDHCGTLHQVVADTVEELLAPLLLNLQELRLAAEGELSGSATLEGAGGARYSLVLSLRKLPA